MNSETQQNILNSIDLVNDVTAKFSMSLKPHFEHLGDQGIDAEPNKLFHTKYLRDHVNEDKETLLMRYHAGSEKLYRERLQNPPLSQHKEIAIKEKSKSSDEKKGTGEDSKRDSYY